MLGDETIYLHRADAPGAANPHPAKFATVEESVDGRPTDAECCGNLWDGQQRGALVQRCRITSALPVAGCFHVWSVGPCECPERRSK